jgi:hypothetical protein
MHNPKRRFSERLTAIVNLGSAVLKFLLLALTLLGHIH